MLLVVSVFFAFAAHSFFPLACFMPGLASKRLRSHCTGQPQDEGTWLLLLLAVAFLSFIPSSTTSPN